MKIAKVTGSVVSTVKVDSLNGVILLLIQPLDDELKAKGPEIVACDAVQAGPGDLVIYEGGREAAMSLKNQFNPADAAVIGIIDQLERAEQ